MCRIPFFLVFIFAACFLQAQEILRLDFDDEFVPAEWEFTHKSEWAHVLGENGSSYFRFHPFSWRDVLQTPELELDEGHYVLYYSWNEAGSANPDFCNIRIREGDDFWDAIDRIGVGNNRTWQKDSTVIGNLTTGAYTLEFEYKSLGHYPSEYLNLDNIYLVRREVITGIDESLAGLSFNIYPNPVQTELHYQLKDETHRTFEMKIYNELGQSVHPIIKVTGNDRGVVDVNYLPAGIYNIELSHREGRTASRFIIAH